jgi:hypothetical protein
LVASSKIPIIAYHFPWPGIGHVAKKGDNYRYVAIEMQTVLYVVDDSPPTKLCTSIREPFGRPLSRC